MRIDAVGLLGRISAETVRAPSPLPGFDNSQMDGFALRGAELTLESGGSAALPLAGTVPAGSAAPELPQGEAVAVMTGAPIPLGADTVVPVEKTRDGFSVLAALERGEPAEVVFTGLSEQDLEPGTFIRQAGSDVGQAEVLIEAGQALTPARIAVLAACGLPEVRVMSRVRTLVISTGEEIRAPGEPLEPGQIYDANAVLIRAVCEGFGHTVTVARLASDVPHSFVEALDELVTRHHPHLVITAGGISAGAYEVVRQALAEHGITFGSVAQQPGGPQGWGMLSEAGPALVALPGNPVSCAVSLETLLRPALAVVDPASPAQRRVQATLSHALSSPPGLRQYRRVQLTPGESNTVTAVPVGGPSSHLLGHLARADALLELNEDDTDVPAGVTRSAILLSGRDWTEGESWTRS